MNEKKCMECGTQLTGEMTECPECGCPIEQVEQPRQETAQMFQPQIFQAVESAKAATKKKLRIMPFVSLVLGVVIVLLGYTVINKKADAEVYRAKDYDLSSAEFGGDFYTEIYAASDMIVDELSEINGGMESLSVSINAGVDVIYFSAGMIIIALGLGTMAMSCVFIKKEH